MRYDKKIIEEQALVSVRNGRMTDTLGQFVIDRCEEISRGIFKPHSDAYHRALVDYALMQVCEQFLDRYKEGRSAANLIISMIHSAMIDRIRAMQWKDVYGELNKSHVRVVNAEGQRKSILMQVERDDTISRVLSGERINDLL